MDLSEIKQFLKSGQTSQVKDALYFLFDYKTYDEEIVKIVSNLVVSNDRGIQSLAIDCLKSLPDEFKEIASREIAPLVASDNIEHRNIASDILVNYKDLCYDALRGYLSHPSPDVRQFALDIWGNIGSKKDWYIVFAMLNDENKNVVISAIMALGNIKVSEAVDELLKKYEEDDEYKPFVLNALGKIGGEEARNFLLNVINNESDPLLQLAAIDSLGYSEPNIEFVKYLLSKIVDAPISVQPYFLKTICQLGKPYRETIEHPPQLKEIARTALKEDDIEIRKAALTVLGSSYDVLDVDSLIVELLRFEPENVEMIFQNVVHKSSVEVFSDFIEKLTFQKDNGEIFASLLDFFFREWDAMNEEKKIALMSTIFSLVDELPESVVNDFCDWFSYREPETFKNVLHREIENSIGTKKNMLEEIASRY